MIPVRGPGRGRGRTLVLAGVAALGAWTTAACGGADHAGVTPQRTVTVTSTPLTPSDSASASPTATSDVLGRSFDVGTVASVSNVGGVLVVDLDRWTLPGTSDSTLAAKGVPLSPHVGPRFTNQNTSKTYRAPVALGARVVVNTCVKAADGQLGLRSSPFEAATWLQKPDRALVFVVTYDPAGAIIKMESDPVCLS